MRKQRPGPRVPATACVILLVSLTGCVALGRQYEGAELQTTKLAVLQVGSTSKADILTLFGAPTLIQRRDIEGLLTTLAVRYQGQDLTVKLDPALFDDIYIYEYRRVNRTFVSVGVFSWAASVDKSDRLVFFFDAEGRLAGYGLTEGTAEL
jgi:hypothetical protein